jgi:hypothetical protein
MLYTPEYTTAAAAINTTPTGNLNIEGTPRCGWAAVTQRCSRAMRASGKPRHRSRSARCAYCTWCLVAAAPAPYSQLSLIKPLISPGVANTTDARSPIMPDPMITGFPAAGPSLPESVLMRKLKTQILCVAPLASSPCRYRGSG